MSSERKSRLPNGSLLFFGSPCLARTNDTAVAKTPLVGWKFCVHLGDSCGARNFFAWRRKSRPLRPHRLASSATGGASALRLPTSPAQSTSTRLLSAASAGDQQETKRKHHPNGWCFLFGSPCWARTNDTAVNSRMLCRLS